ncbi:MAG TPA: hypothetical protein VEB43_11700 [Anaeromyxobacter sp.]|nr:hypothetical protein [Anaeromyxobacter sp.]
MRRLVMALQLLWGLFALFVTTYVFLALGAMSTLIPEFWPIAGWLLAFLGPWLMVSGAAMDLVLRANRSATWLVVIGSLLVLVPCALVTRDALAGRWSGGTPEVHGFAVGFAFAAAVSVLGLASFAAALGVHRRRRRPGAGAPAGG